MIIKKSIKCPYCNWKYKLEIPESNIEIINEVIKIYAKQFRKHLIEEHKKEVSSK